MLASGCSRACPQMGALPFLPPPALSSRLTMMEAPATTDATPSQQTSNEEPATIAADASSPSAAGGGAPKLEPCWQIASAPVGAVYEGELSIRGVAAGRGKLTFASGDVYEGEFKGRRMDGYGRMIYIDGDTYEGEWKCDEHHGKGKYSFPPPSCAYYDGELVEGNANGYGVKVWEDGSKYTGEWKHNMYHGTGTKLDPDGEVPAASRTRYPAITPTHLVP